MALTLMPRSRPVTAAAMVVVAGAYFGSAQAGFAFAFATRQVTAVWPPSGVALAALVLGGRRMWPAVAAGAFAANLVSHESVLTAAGIAVGNTLEAVAGAWLLTRVLGFCPSLARVRDVLALVFGAGMLSTALSATIGVACLRLAGIVPSGHVIDVWRVWWLGDLGGDLLVAPVLMVVGSMLLDRGRRAVPVLAESAGAACCLALLGIVLFGSSEPVAYLLFPVLFGVALHLRQSGAVFASFALACVSVTATRHGYGQFAAPDPDLAVLRAQTFVGAVAVTALLVAATRAEREVAERDAAAARHRIVERDAANAAKSRFVANVGHELRTPMHVLLWFTENLLSARSGPLTDKQREQLQTVRRNGRHLSSLIEEMLDVARLESGKTTLTIETVDCAEVVHEVATGLAPLAREKGLALHVDAELGLVTETDRRALSQILINLTNNAIKYTDAGEIHVELSRVRVDGGELARLAVRDTGRGIPLADVHRLFAAFEQARDTVDGLGLGLHICQLLAQQLDARIAVTSEAGSGSVFTLDLPVRSSPRVPALLGAAQS